MHQSVHCSQHDRMSNLCGGGHSRSGRLRIQIRRVRARIYNAGRPRPVVRTTGVPQAQGQRYAAHIYSVAPRRVPASGRDQRGRTSLPRSAGPPSGCGALPEGQLKPARRVSCSGSRARRCCWWRRSRRRTLASPRRLGSRKLSPMLISGRPEVAPLCRTGLMAWSGGTSRRRCADA